MVCDVASRIHLADPTLSDSSMDHLPPPDAGVKVVPPDLLAPPPHGSPPPLCEIFRCSLRFAAICSSYVVYVVLVVVVVCCCC